MGRPTMDASDGADRFVLLRDGPPVPLPAYLLLLDLEARGFTVEPDRQVLVVRPPERLTPADCAAIRRWKRIFWCSSTTATIRRSPRTCSTPCRDRREGSAVPTVAVPCDTSHRPDWPALLREAADIVTGYDDVRRAR